MTREIRPMTPTSEERREVAERLRKAADSDEWLDVTINNAIFGVFGEVRHPISDTLADLIDPTCKVSSVETYCNELGQLEGWEFHLTCGHSFQRPWNEPPAYCPGCGARVVDEDAD